MTAQIFALTESVLSGVGIKYDSFGYHVATMTPEKVVSSQKVFLPRALRHLESIKTSLSGVICWDFHANNIHDSR